MEYVMSIGDGVGTGTIAALMESRYVDWLKG
jgi:hypothetical protein